MLNYILEVSLCWFGFFLLYHFLLRKETFHQINRWYLIGTLTAGMGIPLPEFSTVISPEPSLTEYYLQTITIGLENFEEIVVTAATETNLTSEISTITVLLWIYWTGVLIGFARFGYGLFQISKLYKTAKIIRKDDYVLVETDEPHLPFSFLNYLFLNAGGQSKKLTTSNSEISDADRQKIIKHEEAHIRQGHSYDVLFLEVLSILLWCSPLIYFYKNSLRIVHEFLADDSVLQISKKKQYGRLLLRQSQSGMQIALANNFFHSQLKKRLEMMTKTKSKRKALLKYAFVLPIMALAVLLFAKEDVLNNFDLSNTILTECNLDEKAAEMKFREGFQSFEYGKEGWMNEADKILTKIFTHLNNTYPNCEKEIIDIGFATAKEYKHKFMVSGDGKVTLLKPNMPSMQAPDGLLNNDPDIFRVVEEMPRFPGCEDVENETDKDKCAQTELIQFIYKNLTYPKAARNAGIEGMVVVKFVVGKNGEILNPEITRPIGGGCDEEVLRVVNEMPNWIPGKQKGETVKVQFNLPVRFKLDEDVAGKTPPGKVNIEEELKPDEVDQMPLFEGTNTDGTPEEIKKSSNMALINHILQHLKYPKTAAKAEVEGMVVAKFIVKEDGSVSGAEIKRSLHVDCDAQVIRVIEAMPKWTPAQKDGKAVSMSVMLPVKFKLDDQTKENAAKSELPDAVQNLNVEEFKAYPNPTTGKVNIAFKTVAAPTSVLIVDSFGKEVFRKDLKNYDGGNQTLFDIDLSHVNKGTLFVVLTQKDGAKKYAERIVLK